MSQKGLTLKQEGGFIQSLVKKQYSDPKNYWALATGKPFLKEQFLCKTYEILHEVKQIWAPMIRSKLLLIIHYLSFGHQVTSIFLKLIQRSYTHLFYVFYLFGF